MKRLSVDKLHVRYLPGTGHDSPVIPRRYTLTHSDLSGDLYLTVGANYEQAQVSGWYTKLMRDEVLAEWEVRQGEAALLVHCHISGGFVIGWAGWRDAIFRRELPLVLEALRFGDRALFDAHTELDRAPIWVHFHAKQPRYDVVQSWGTPADYRELSPTTPIPQQPR